MKRRKETPEANTSLTVEMKTKGMTNRKECKKGKDYERNPQETEL